MTDRNAMNTIRGKCVPHTAPGRDGLSAYEIAVKNGFKGTEKEWLSSLNKVDPDIIRESVDKFLENNPVETSVTSVNGKKGAVQLSADDVGAVGKSQLPEAVNSALKQAKDSGKFDGKDGEDGQDGQNGSSVTVKKVVESTADGGSNVVTFSDGKTLTVKNGKNGQDGRTPVKDKDYFDGEDGKSAYELAVKNGFKGTEVEWLESLGGASDADIKEAVDKYFEENPVNVNPPTGDYVTKAELEELAKDYQPKGNYLTEHQKLKTINGQSLIGEGNITIEGGKAINYDLNVKAINHRGYSAGAPENTIPAYIMSKLKGFTYVECDVAFTSDNVAVLLHDATIDRTSNGAGSLKNLSYAQVMQYDFGYSDLFGDAYKGTKIPTFKEFIILCKNLGLHPYIELKSSDNYSQSQITQVVNEVAECGMKGKVTYISFNNDFLKYVKNADSSARLGLLGNPFNASKLSQAMALKTATNEVFADAKLDNLDPSIISSCISNGIPLEVWTVNEVGKIESMSPYITGVTSDSLIAGEILYNKSLVYTAPEVSYVPATSVTLSETSLTFEDLTSKTLTATVLPTNTSDKVIWSSSDEAIAKVTNGVVIPQKSGNCTITAKAGSVSASCAVTVDVNVEIYSITRNFDNCVSSSSVTTVMENSSHTETISPSSGYELAHENVTVTMDGVDITSCYSEGVLNVGAVTGDIVITASATKLPLIPVVDLDLTSIADGQTLINTGSGGTQYNATISTVNATDSFSAGENGLSLLGHAYANVSYGFKASDKFTIVARGSFDDLSTNTYQRLFRTDRDAPCMYYYTTENTFAAKLAGVSGESLTKESDIVTFKSGRNSLYIEPSKLDFAEFHDYVFVCDGTKIYWYVDGVLSGSQKASPLWKEKTPTLIGLGDNDPAKTYYANKITISKFMIFDCALSADEINAL
jgi:glycerophosphoryl diester phosphodiesterase